jgi:hypothetical protein
MRSEISLDWFCGNVMASLYCGKGWVVVFERKEDETEIKGLRHHHLSFIALDAQMVLNLESSSIPR